MLREIEITVIVNALDLLRAKRAPEIELNIKRGSSHSAPARFLCAAEILRRVGSRPSD